MKIKIKRLSFSDLKPILESYRDGEISQGRAVEKINELNLEHNDALTDAAYAIEMCNEIFKKHDMHLLQLVTSSWLDRYVEKKDE